MTDPLDVAADKLCDLGASPAEANALCCMIDLFGFPDSLEDALAEHRAAAELYLLNHFEGRAR